MDKLKPLYLKYLQLNLPKMKKEELVHVVAPLILKAIDFTKEDQADLVRECIVNDMKRNPEVWGEDEKRTVLQGDEIPPDLPVGESDGDMYTPMSVQAAMEYISALEPTDGITREDIANAINILDQLGSYLFSTEVPEIAVVDDTLAFGWQNGKRGSVLVFTDGEVYMQLSPSIDEGVRLELNDDMQLSDEDVQMVLKEVHSVKY